MLPQLVFHFLDMAFPCLFGCFFGFRHADSFPTSTMLVSLSNGLPAFLSENIF
jgi:hypothetical protein